MQEKVRIWMDRNYFGFVEVSGEFGPLVAGAANQFHLWERDSSTIDSYFIPDWVYDVAEEVDGRYSSAIKES